MSGQVHTMPAFPYQIEELDEEIHLLRYLDDCSSLVEIPSFINGKPVTSIGDSCFNCHSEIEQLVFPSSLVSIGAFAFTMCRRIHELILPDSITEIGICTFRDCKGLRGGKIVLPSGLKTISQSLFSFTYMDGVDLTLPRDLELIETHAFYSAGSFDLILPSPKVVIQDGAFAQSGVHVISSIPEQRGWYMDWPYGQQIATADGKVGTIDDYRSLCDGCMELTVMFPNGARKLFYPSFSAEYSFISDENQRMMWDTLSKTPGVNGVFRSWQRGLI